MDQEIKVIPKAILEIEKRIQKVDSKEGLSALKIVIVKATAKNIDNFSYLHKVFIRQKRKLGIKCEAGKKMTI